MLLTIECDYKHHNEHVVNGINIRSSITYTNTTRTCDESDSIILLLLLRTSANGKMFRSIYSISISIYIIININITIFFIIIIHIVKLMVRNYSRSCD